MRKVALLITLLLVLLGCGQVMAQEKNWCIDPGSTVSSKIEKTIGMLDVMAGTPNNVRDNDINTYYWLRGHCPYVLDVGYYLDVTFPKIVGQINRVELVHRYYSAYTNFPGTATLRLFYEGSWHDIFIKDFTGNNPVTTNSQTGDWHNVEKVELYFRVKGSGSHPVFDHYAYELRAWGGPAYIDIGVRVYDGTQVVAIACEPDTSVTSSLRISRNGRTYGVVLVDPTDSNASKVRVQTKSGIKALRKYP